MGSIPTGPTEKTMNTRIVFMGSPEFAVPTLKTLAESFFVVGVVTQPDRPSGRGRILNAPPIKKLALELNIPVIQPERLRRQPEAMEQLRAWKPDLIVVAAFGQILRQDVLDLPCYGCINVHASLLPKWRGAAPIQAAILNGDTITGVTIMCMEAGVDTGSILAQAPVPISPQDTAASLSERLAITGADLLARTLPGYLDGSITPIAQDHSQATHAPMLKKEDGLLDPRLPAIDLAYRVRAYNPWPGAYLLWKGQPLKVLRATAIPTTDQTEDKLLGRRIIVSAQPAIMTSEGVLILDEIQPAGKKPMPGKLFLSGARDWGSCE